MTAKEVLVGRLLEDFDLLGADELCRSCAIETETLSLFVREGIVDPVGDEPVDWRFTVASIKRVRTAVHLQRDLGVNPAGAALALELLDRIAELERI